METYEQLRRLYAAFNERDIERVLAALHPEVVWPNGWEGGTLHGVEAVRTYWLRQWQAIDPWVEPVRWWTEPDGRITVEVHQVVRSVDGRGAVLGESTVEHVYRWRDGLVDSMEIREPAAPPTPHTPPARPPRAVRRLERAVAALLLTGLMTEQISPLADLRVRARRGAYDDDGYGTILGSRQADRRHGFARSLVETGRRSDERERLRDRRKGWRIPGTAHHVARLGHATSTPGPTTGGRT